MGERKYGKVTVYYDGACPSCVRDRCHYEKLAGEDSGVDWFDITGRDDELRALGIDPKRALTELHIVDEDHNVLAEIDAYRVLMNRVPRFKPLAWLIGLPVIRPIVSRVYHWRVNRRLMRDGRL